MYVRVSGVTGPCAARCNGVFEPTAESSRGCPVYQKRGDADVWLEYSCSGMWMITSSSGRAKGDGWAYVTCAPCAPEGTPRGAWQVFNGTAHRAQPQVTVSAVGT